MGGERVDGVLTLDLEGLLRRRRLDRLQGRGDGIGCVDCTGSRGHGFQLSNFVGLESGHFTRSIGHPVGLQLDGCGWKPLVHHRIPKHQEGERGEEYYVRFAIHRIESELNRTWIAACRSLPAHAGIRGFHLKSMTGLIQCCGRHRISTASPPGMTTADAPQGEQGPTKRAVGPERIQGVLGAGGIKPAA